jgi:hypothetical protein
MTQPALLFILSVAICATIYLALACHQRPIMQAYELGDRHGYERGRRDAIMEANRAVVTPIHSTRRTRRVASRALQQV